MGYTIKILSQNGQTHTAIDIGSVISAKVTKKINSADHFIMKWSGEGLESDLQAFNNGIMVEDATGHVIFGGRIVSIIRDIYGFYEIESEGALAYLNDYVVAPFELTKANGWSPSTLNRAVYTYVSNAYDHVASRGVDNTWSVLEMLPQYCNGANPELLVGEVSTDYMTCYEMLKNLVVDIAGNYLEVVYTKSGDEFVPKLYVKSTLNRESTQTLNLGSNIMDFNMSNDYTDICTRVFVFGARKKDSDKRYSLLDAGRSTKYLNADADVVNRYGVIAKSLIYDKVKNPARLLKIAENYLKKHDRPHTVISLTAIDLSLINSSIDNFRLGDLVQVNVATSNFNAKVQVKTIEYDLINIQNSKITCESAKKTQSNWLKSNIDLLEGLNSYTSWGRIKEL